MRIAHMVSHEALNGVATSTKALIDLQLRAGHDIMLVHKPGAWIGSQDFTGRFERLETSFPTSYSELKRVGYRIVDWQRDIVHAHGSRANKYLMLYRIVAGVPSVMTAHALHFQLTWPFSHEIIAPAPQAAEYYKRWMLVRSKNIHVVPNILDTGRVVEASDAERLAVRRELQISDGAFVLGAVGEVATRKNQVAMLDVLRVLLNAGVNANLVLVGGVRMPEGWRERFDDPALASRVKLLGQRQDAVRIMAAIDLYLCTSLAEVQPIAIMESMAVGRPVATYDVGGCGDLVRPGTGKVVPMHDLRAMSEYAGMLARDPQARMAAGREARRAIVANHSPEVIGPAVEQIYRKAVARARDRYRAKMPKPHPGSTA